MGYHKDNFKRIRAEFDTKALEAQKEAEGRREEIYAAIPEVRLLDQRLSTFGLRIMQAALESGDTVKAIDSLRCENERILESRAALLRQNGFPADYSDPHYDCAKCHDSGYVGVKMCECMRLRLVEAGMESSGLSTLMRTQSFENFSLSYYQRNAEESRRMEHNLKTLREYADNFSLESGKPVPDSMLFIGGTGLGKTHLSTSIARRVIERGYDVFYNSAVGMLSDFEFRRFGNALASSDGDNTDRYMDCDLLIIDDLGTEVVNQFTLSCIYHIINTRLNLERPTIISTNLSSADLRKSYNDRITSRLMGDYVLIPFYGTDVRRQKITNQ